MKKAILGTLAAAFLSASALPLLAQVPKGPQDCKPTEQWDEATKTCKPAK